MNINWMKNGYIRVRNMCLALYTEIYGNLHPLEKKVLFLSFGGRQYSDNPRAISEKLKKINEDVDIVWGVQKNSELDTPSNIRTVNTQGLAFYRELATSACFVTNNDIRTNIHKKKGQLFVQTFHGDRGFKKCLYSLHECDPPVIDDDVTDICVSGSKFGEDIVYRKMLRFTGEFLRVGCPRNDCLLNWTEEEAIRIKQKLGINKNAKVLLYAPTYRDNSNEGQCVNIDFQVINKELEKNGEEWICLVRAHHIARQLLTESVGCKDVTDYGDMADLLMISDLLITDYSSSAGDFVLRKKPVILYINDIDIFEHSCREFEIDPRKTPYLVATSEKELLTIISSLSEADYQNRCEMILGMYGAYETGRASEAVCQRIIDFLQK